MSAFCTLNAALLMWTITTLQTEKRENESYLVCVWSFASKFLPHCSTVQTLEQEYNAYYCILLCDSADHDSRITKPANGTKQTNCGCDDRKRRWVLFSTEQTLKAITRYYIIYMYNRHIPVKHSGGCENTSACLQKKLGRGWEGMEGAKPPTPLSPLAQHCTCTREL